MRSFTIATAFIIIGSAAFGQSAEDALKARQGFMKMMSFEMGTLSGMAKGEIAYDEAVARAAATNLMALTDYNAPKLFVPGSSSADLDASDALPAIWEDQDDFAAKFAALDEAAAGIDQTVIGGQESLAPVVQQLGVACSNCHKPYRQDR